MAGYALKADILHYFEMIDHEVLLSILRKKISGEDTIWIIKTILSNHKAKAGKKGMPLGNLTSQFFANLYLGELDTFVKRELRAKYYLRYVDDFILLSKCHKELDSNQKAIHEFLSGRLKLALHPQKTGIIPISSGITLLGFRVFSHFRLLKKSNQRRIKKRVELLTEKFAKGKISKESMLLSLSGWEGYAKMANTFKLRKKLRSQLPD
ncbi:MAG: RNA-directed DNA polymerase [Candidatus Micrarchaeota archaeon]